MRIAKLSIILSLTWTSILNAGMVSNSCEYTGTVNDVIAIAGPGFNYVTAVRVPIEGGDLYIDCYNASPRCWDGFSYVSCSCNFQLQPNDCISTKGVLKENNLEVYCAATTFQALSPSKCQ